MIFQSGVLHVSELELSANQRRDLVARGSLEHICRGWYALPGADPDAVAARRVGGALTAQSLLKKYNVWLPRDRRLHVRVRPHASDIDPRRACFHRLEPAATPRDEIPLALQAMAHCSPRNDVVAAIDSVLDLGLARFEEIEAVARRYWKLRDAVNAAAHGSQAGGESQVRLFLRAHGIKFELQKQISPAGRVDLLVGDRLVIEVDGRAHHLGTQFEDDRRRDLLLLARGYLVVRLSYHQLWNDWEAAQQVLLDLVRRGDHLWRGKLASSGLQ